MSARLFIVEDEPELAALVADYARAAGYQGTVFGDGAIALAAIRAGAPDLVVLDLMLPGLDGLALCRAVRAFSEVPIVMVTAQVEEIDRLLGLEAGADDYLCKPFSPRELMARIKAILRRSGGAAPERAISVDEAGQRICIHGRPLELTPTEFGILAGLARRPGQVFSRTQLLDLACQGNLEATDRAVDSHIKNLRRKLAAALPDCDAIHSIYGLGYRLDL
ncbi:two-component system response regulator BaeR [Massilia eurypsychrophila]|jgi:two-component system response regulator BaeR|uniref:Two-component system response regulator BaeR n=1 Tax=Massilia eurypsychrophila TaxID=1485217 RepID=A0A2G8T8Z5_9BURK|nr:response regulator [Massilia eurypsychrophila]PIL42527.1 two-component system response regulator BaeR [Massilia eurypsychrophila]